MRHHIRQTHITDELQTGKAAGVAGGFPASGAQYHPLTSAPPRSPASPEPVHDAGVLRVAPQWRHGRQIPRLFPGSHAVQPLPNRQFHSTPLQRCGMQAKFGNSKSHRNISHHAFPQSLRGSKDDWASASCCHSAAVFSSGFGGITIFSTAYRSPVCFLLTRPLPLTRNRCPA